MIKTVDGISYKEAVVYIPDCDGCSALGNDYLCEKLKCEDNTIFIMIETIKAEPITDQAILNKTYTYEEMLEAFIAGINRGCYIASMINGKPLDEPFPYWSAFIKVLVNEPKLKEISDNDK